eukprot:606872-Pleurochrysis_carterae.AAC.1
MQHARRENHYSSATCSFSCSFVVGPLNDVCCDEAGLAKGLAFGTNARAWCDVCKSRALREGRRNARDRKESKKAIAIQTWIGLQKERIEGSKAKEKTALCIRAKRPVIGSQLPFQKIWRTNNDDIQQIKAKQHAKCDMCGKLQVQIDSAKRRSDAHGRQVQDEISQQKVRVAS